MSYQLDPVRAAWNIGAMVRWLDYNDTWLAAEWGHPSDNLGAILALADYQSRQRLARGEPSLTMKDVIVAMIKAHEVQGVIALENSFNRVGLDHVMLVRIASTAVAAQMLGCTRDETLAAVSHAWLDGSALRTYRHAPNTGSRKSWAAGDASGSARGDSGSNAGGSRSAAAARLVMHVHRRIDWGQRGACLCRFIVLTK